MTNTTKMELLTKENFGEMEVSFYKDENENIFMIRNQIGEALEYKNPNDAIRLLHKKNAERLDQFSVTFKLNGTDGKLYNTTLYNEKGIYEIMRKSNQPKADEFYDFVYEVIEKVRKNGGYIHVEEGMTDAEIMAKALLISQRTIEEQKPKVEVYDAIMSEEGLHSFSEVARLLGTGRKRLFNRLRELEVLYKDNSPYQYYVDQKYFRVVIVPTRAGATKKTLFTQRGVDWITRKKEKFEIRSE